MPHYYIVLTAAISADDLPIAAVQHGDMLSRQVFDDDGEPLPVEQWLPDMLQYAAWSMAKPLGLSEEGVTLRVEPATPDAPAGIAELFHPCPAPAGPQDQDERWPRGPKCPNHRFQVWPCATTLAAWQLRGADELEETQRALNRLTRPWTDRW